MAGRCRAGGCRGAASKAASLMGGRAQTICMDAYGDSLVLLERYPETPQEILQLLDAAVKAVRPGDQAGLASVRRPIEDCTRG